MATCNASQLKVDAVASGFLPAAMNDSLFRPLVLQLLKDYSGTTDTYDQIKANAVANGFLPIAQNEPLFRKLVIQLLCEKLN